MGVDICVYRARIGTFLMPNKSRNRMSVLCVSKGAVSLCLRTLVALSLLLVVSGSVEVNPGPGTQRQNSQNSQNSQVSTRQRTLSFAQATSGSTGDTRRLSVQGNHGEKESTGEIMTFLNTMKLDLASQNKQVMTDINSLSSKIDSVDNSIKELRTENECLKQENEKMRHQVSTLTTKIDNLEGHSRRNNLRIHGIEGTLNERWDVCEEKVRNFIKNDLNLPECENVENERAHRLKSRNHDKCTIIVKFNRYKDREQILRAAAETLDKGSACSVQQDYTDRVKTARRELGKLMIDARNNGKYASIRHDKLIIQNNVYRYDFDNECPILVSSNDRAWTRPRGSNVNDDPLAGTRERGGANNFGNEAAGGVSDED